jgi:hypothetical protein
LRLIIIRVAGKGLLVDRFARVFAGIRVLFCLLHALPLCGAALALGCLVTLVWFAFVFAGVRALSCLLHALPLCGAALTFFAAAKKVSKESGLTPPVLDHRLRAPTVPPLHTAICHSLPVANASAKRLTHFKHP